MQSALHQHAGPAKLDRFIDAFLYLFDRMDVCVRPSRPSIKGAEGADDVADVGIIDVAVNYICDDIGWIFSLANFVSGESDADKIAGFE